MKKFLSVLIFVLVLCAGAVCLADGETAAAASPFIGTAWSLLPPFIAIALALITKEVYSSLFIGIVSGALLYANFNPEMALNQVFSGSIVAVLSSSYNIGILVFLVVLGAMVSILNKAGGSAAFGRWAATHIKSRVGSQLAVILLGCLIFIDDYFNCLTVGSVMRPVSDKHRISRAKLAYLIDATAAPVCIIAPVSSWAAAVSSYVEDGQGLSLFLRAIPYNYYALLTILMMVLLAIFKLDFGPMAKHETNAIAGDLFSGKEMFKAGGEEDSNPRARVIDLVLPVLILMVCCVIGMIYSGGFFSGASFVQAFSDCDASVGLMLGSSVTLVLTVAYFLIRRTLSFKQLMECIPEGFKAMVPAILILTFAWSLKATTDALNAGEFVDTVVRASAGAFNAFLPAIVFAIGCVISFATGTSWGTFGILIPITMNVFPLTDPLGIVCISACMAGAVCGDHCSPISDTTIMASAGAQCDHVTHVSTQLPYALTVAAVSFVGYLITGFLPAGAKIAGLPITAALMIAVLFGLRAVNGRKAK